jgi:hypothetical protein
VGGARGSAIGQIRTAACVARRREVAMPDNGDERAGEGGEDECEAAKHLLGV